jgi:hypothetical protein
MLKFFFFFYFIVISTDIALKLNQMPFDYAAGGSTKVVIDFYFVQRVYDDVINSV